MIDDQIADSWSPELREQLKDLEQGDVFRDLVPFGYYGRQAASTTRGARILSDNPDDIQFIEVAPAPDGWIVTTQTCDIAEEDRPRPVIPFLELAPVYKVSAPGPVLSLEVGAIGISYLVPLTGSAFKDETWVADLRYRQSIDKGLVQNRPAEHGFASASDARHFAQRLAYFAARPAFEKRVVEHIISPLRQYFRKRAPMREKMLSAQLRELRLRTSAESVELIVILEKDGDFKDAREALTDWYVTANKKCADAGVELLPIRFGTLAMLDAQCYEQSERLMFEWVVARGSDGT